MDIALLLLSVPFAACYPESMLACVHAKNKTYFKKKNKISVVKFQKQAKHG